MAEERRMANGNGLATEIQERIREIKRHNELYFSQAKPEISDAEYDKLLRETKALVEQLRAKDGETDIVLDAEQVLSEVGAEPSYGKTVEHPSIMGSLEKVAYDPLALLAWRRQYPGSKIASTPKIDGCALRIVYERGRLALAATRGNGCLDGSTEIELEGGQKVTLGDVVSQGIKSRVKCFDTETGKIEYREIVELFNNGESEGWHVVVVENDAGEQRELIVTGGHQIWVRDDGRSRGRYVEASKLAKGDIVVGT